MDYSHADPLSSELVRMLDEEGRLLKDRKPPLEPEQLRKAYSDMLFAREADLMAVSFQRQGRMFTYPPNKGQEAIGLAAGIVMQDPDWLVPSFRELAAWLARGVSLKEIFMFWRGHEDAFVFQNAPRVFPIAVPIASQIPHAAGLAFALKSRGEGGRVFTFVGDGGTSEGDFHEGLNFAAVWKAPLVCIIQNNQFAISVPRENQTSSPTLAAKALAYGIPGIRVDGNDLFAMVDVLRWAADWCPEHGPVLIEAVTYRMGAHTTSDDPRKYRSREEEASWEKKDPLLRLEAYLKSEKLLTGDEIDSLVEQHRESIRIQFEEAEAYSDYPLDQVFAHMYGEPPEDLQRQKLEQEQFIRWLKNTTSVPDRTPDRTPDRQQSAHPRPGIMAVTRMREGVR